MTAQRIFGGAFAPVPIVTPLLSCLVGAFLLSACKDHGRARASADPDRAHAKATAGDADEDDTYDAGRVTRTGVFIDARVASACGVHEPEAFFAFDSDELAPSARDTLELVAECLDDGALKDREVVLVGHADPRGSDEYNKELGMSRAQAVAGFLRQSGVPKTRIETKSAGERGASGDERGWPMDRRVDITLDESSRPASSR